MKLPFPNTHHPHYSFHHTLFPTFKPKPTCPRMDSTTPISRRHRRKDKIIVIMGATGTGKSRLSIDLASLFPSEIINSDKMQIYKGLDITTNKISIHDRLDVPHHLLGEVSLEKGELTPSEFRSVANSVISNITTRRKLPIVVGGSNSFIHALVVDRFDSGSDVFTESHSVSKELRYNCCFLWVDVSLTVLNDYLSKRVDEMLDSGMFDELSEFYDSDGVNSVGMTGLRKAIGVPEFDRYFNRFPPPDTDPDKNQVRRVAYEEAVKEIKDNTCQLAKRQIGKILHLSRAGWELRRVDATEAFRAVVTSDSGKARWSDIWERQVVEPSVKIVKRFLQE